MFNNSIFTALLRDDQGGDGVGEERWRRRERGECGEWKKPFFAKFGYQNLLVKSFDSCLSRFKTP